MDTTVSEAPQNSQAGMLMSASAKTARRLARMQNIMKIAQLGLPGGSAAPAAPAGGANAAPTDPSLGGMAGGAGDLGLGSLTGASDEMGGGMSDSPINDSPEPGNKAPWGTICPQCGSKDVDVANGEGSCNSCNAHLKYKFTVEVAPPEEKSSNTEAPTTEPALAPMPPTGGPMGAPEAGAGGLPGTPPTGAAPAAPGAGALASNYKLMTRIAYRTSADVYAAALSDSFNKDVATKLPVGMICPACGSRTASKKSKHTYCYDCGTLSVSEIKRVEGEPGILEANIVWL
jgi:Zn finger protein HypA/HybF involved in hydrogenase expression